MSQIRDIEGFEGRYKVTSEGVVYSYHLGKWKKRKATFQKGGYLSVTLWKKRRTRFFLLHRLVLETFVGPCPKGMEARHFPDRRRTNCRLSNLRWGTRARNQKDRVFHQTDNRGERSGNTNLTWEIVRKIRKMYITGKFTQSELGRMYGISHSAAHNIIKVKKWKE